jgi:pSer/pThr/pTyr-binding forkhead associated (FHA) protein|nr:FHA domain-containing protein [Kofleriaceae bacterium]
MCVSPRSIGVLCTSHGVAIASPGITSEQVVSRVAEGVASLIDAWGIAHPIIDGTRLGRDVSKNDVAVLHASVSSEHATIKIVDGKWRVIDSSSRNGTEVNNLRVSDVELAPGATLRLGDIKLYFWPESLPKVDPPRGSGRTAPTRRDELVFSARVTTPRGHALDLRQRVDGGVLRLGDASIELAAMEFGLLQLLVERRRTVSDAELAYVAWHEIADALSFRSVQADSENVRELVHRVRRKLAGVNAEDLIESKRGVGYRLAGEPR